MALLAQGCGPGKQNQGAGGIQTLGGPMPTVRMTLPKSPAAGQTVVLSVYVTQAGKPYNNADDVMFEIWKDAPGAKHRLLHAKRTGDGVYGIHYRFPAPGTYDVMYHVVAAGNMIMTGPQRLTVRG
ncbi:MAG: FixH family protein [Alicyclobacillus sp.]|nr:FixH family protein [Alicyclobacillus sp.]